MIQSLTSRCVSILVRINHHRSHPLASVIVRSNHNQAEWLEDNLKLKIQEGPDETYVEAIPTATGREGKVLKVESGACALCRLNLPNLAYTDVMILSQFIKRNGRVVTYHESRLCSKQYKKVIKLINDAQRCNLMQRPPDYFVPGAWHNLNTYLEPDRKRDQPMKVVKPEYWRI